MLFCLPVFSEKTPEAEIYYGKAMEINPDDANCLSNYAVYHTNTKKDYDKAEQLFSRACGLN